MAVLITNGAFGCGLHFARLPGICNSRYIEKLELKKRSPELLVWWMGCCWFHCLNERHDVSPSFFYFLTGNFPKKWNCSFFSCHLLEREKKSRACLDLIYQSQLERIALFMSCESANAADWKCIETRAGWWTTFSIRKWRKELKRHFPRFPVFSNTRFPFDFRQLGLNNVCLFVFF
jgi:hypothetical protein